jgi:hypothetical protein
MSWTSFSLPVVVFWVLGRYCVVAVRYICDVGLVSQLSMLRGPGGDTMEEGSDPLGGGR